MNHIKKGTALLLAAGWQVTAWAGCASATEELCNPAFDMTVTTSPQACAVSIIQGTLAQNWEDNSCGLRGGAGSTITYGSAVGRSGSGTSQTITTDSQYGAVQAKTWINAGLISGQRYKTTVYLKADRATEVVLQLRSWLAPYTSYGTTVARVGTDWAPFTFEGLAPTGLTAFKPAGLFVLLTGPSTVYLDDASVTSVADTTVGAQGRPATTIPRAFFGTHLHRSPVWPSVGQAIGTERLWDAGGVPRKDPNTGAYKDNTVGANWVGIYKDGPASPNWTDFNGAVDRARANGAEVVMVLGGHLPLWAAADKTGAAGCNLYGPGSSTGPPDAANNDQIWKDWVTAVATQARGKVRLWEVWNEPYMCSLFTSNPRRLADLVASARQILKSIDPANVVLSPSFNLNDNTYLDRYLQVAKAAYPNGEAYGDYLAVHAYPEVAGPLLDERVPKAEADLALMRRSPEWMFDSEHLVVNTKMVLKRFGLDTRPIWDTESGYTWASAANGNPGGQNDAAGAPYVARHALLAWAAGLDRSLNYAWDQRSDVDKDTLIRNWPIAGSREAVEGSFNFVTTPAGVAFGQVSNWVSGATLFSVNKAVDTAGTWEMTLKRGNATSVVVWNPNWKVGSPTVSYTPNAKLTRRTDLAGNVTTVSGPVSITSSPVLFAAPATTVSAASTHVAVWQGWNVKVTLTATVSGGATPTGSVQFQLDGSNLGAPVPLSGGQAVLQTTDIDDAAVAVHAIKAVYLGDNFNPASSSPAGLNIKVCTAVGACP